MAARHEEVCHETFDLHISSYLQKDCRTVTSGRGKGHRISGDSAGSWFRNRRFRYRNVGGGYRSKNHMAQQSATSTAGRFLSSAAVWDSHYSDKKMAKLLIFLFSLPVPTSQPQQHSSLPIRHPTGFPVTPMPYTLRLPSARRVRISLPERQLNSTKTRSLSSTYASPNQTCLPSILRSIPAPQKTQIFYVQSYAPALVRTSAVKLRYL